MYSPSAYQELARQHHAELLREAKMARLAEEANPRSRPRLAARLGALLRRRPAERPALRPAPKPN